MITALIAAGVFDAPPSAGTGTVDAPPERTIAVLRVPSARQLASSLPLGSYPWTAALDPSDRLQFSIDFTDILEPGETIDAIEQLTMSAIGAAVGIEIDDSTGRWPIIDEGGKKIQFWLLVDDAFRSNPAFAGAGVLAGISARISTSSNPVKVYERTGVLTVRQQ